MCFNMNNRLSLENSLKFPKDDILAIALTAKA